jgi:hypothetical protein
MVNATNLFSSPKVKLTSSLLEIAGSEWIQGLQRMCSSLALNGTAAAVDLPLPACASTRLEPLDGVLTRLHRRCEHQNLTPPCDSRRRTKHSTG